MFKIGEILKSAKGKLISGPRNISVNGFSIDSRSIKKDEAFIAIKGNNFDGHDFIAEAIDKGASCVIKNPSSRLISPAGITIIEVRDTVKALGDMANFQRNKFDIPVIAVTGSSGKTTTKEMIAWLLSRKFNLLKNEGTKNNNIGLPLTLLKLKACHEVAVLELGTNHFGEIANLGRIANPNIGIITNIGEAHLEYFKDLKGVLKEKYSLNNYLKKPFICLLNTDDPLLLAKARQGAGKIFNFGFGIGRQSDFTASSIRFDSGRLKFIVNQRQEVILKTIGRHNIYNSLVAIGIARIFGLTYQQICQRLLSFKFPPSRLSLVTFKDVKFIDDTYNSNPVSLNQALSALDNIKASGKKILVMGDMLELGDLQGGLHKQAGEQAAKVCQALVTVGSLSKLAAEAARQGGLAKEDVFSCETTLEAADILFNKIAPDKNDIVLVKGSRAMRMEEIFKSRT